MMLLLVVDVISIYIIYLFDFYSAPSRPIGPHIIQYDLDEATFENENNESLFRPLESNL